MLGACRTDPARALCAPRCSGAARPAAGDAPPPLSEPPPPKGGKTREVPLPASVARRLAPRQAIRARRGHLALGNSDRCPITVTLYLTTVDGLPLSRSKFNPGVWKPAIRATDIPDHRRNGMHVLRHTYASVLLDAGESIKALSTYLGHADLGFILRTYTHLLPTSEDRTRRAIDTAFG
ncbi:tyrosine-type recombinase/integrase [Micromonospora sp. NPDC047620]|uniref:tyrosine-type recombinase/integrase n=1 Tax=Micromonospora sp. NPDC047620 TaxID=3364251 RepID=UPI00371D20A7